MTVKQAPEVTAAFDVLPVQLKQPQSQRFRQNQATKENNTARLTSHVQQRDEQLAPACATIGSILY